MSWDENANCVKIQDLKNDLHKWVVSKRIRMITVSSRGGLVSLSGAEGKADASLVSRRGYTNYELDQCWSMRIVHQIHRS